MGRRGRQTYPRVVRLLYRACTPPARNADGALRRGFGQGRAAVPWAAVPGSQPVRGHRRKTDRAGRDGLVPRLSLPDYRLRDESPAHAACRGDENVQRNRAAHGQGGALAWTTKKTSPEGGARPFDPDRSPGRRDAAGRRRGRYLVVGISLIGSTATNANSETEPCVGCRHRCRNRPNRLAKKKAPSEDGAYRLGRSQIQSSGKWTREEETPFANGHQSREEDTTSARVSQNRTEGGGYGAVHIDKANMDFDRLVSNGAGVMTAMRMVQV